MQFVAVHSRHVDVSDQAGGFGETGRREEIGSRREGLNCMAERPFR